jgi:hypothetical protein
MNLVPAESTSTAPSPRTASDTRGCWPRARGLREHLAETPRGQDHDRSERRADAVALALSHHVERHTLRSTIPIAQQIQHERTLDQLDAWVQGDGRHERSGNLSARRIATGMGDAIAVMTALARQRDRTRGVQIEMRSQADEIAHALGTLGDQGCDGIDIAEPSARDEGVVAMLLGGVVVSKCRSNPPLGPACRALLDSTLGDEEDRPAGAPRMKSHHEPRNTRAHDDDVGSGGPTRRRGEEGDHEVIPTSTGTLSMRRVPSTTTARSRRPGAPGMGSFKDSSVQAT